MTMSRKRLSFLLAAVMLVSVLCSAFTLTASADEDKADAPAAGTPAAGAASAQLPGYASAADRLAAMKPISESAGTTLYFDEATCDIAIKKGDTVYFSSPYNVAGDSLATKEYIQRMASQVCVQYLDAQQSTGTLFSFQDCVAEGQFTTSKLKNGIQVNMVLGTEQKEMLLPLALPAKSFDELILAKLEGRKLSRMKALYKRYEVGVTSQAQVEAIKEKYPAVEQMPIYVMKNSTDTEKEEVQSILKEIGYTQEQLKKDLDAVGAKMQSSSKPYFKFSVQYALEDGDLVVTLPADTIEYNREDFQLLSISLLKNLAAAPMTEEGYIFIPDGSGTVFSFNKDGSKTGATQVFPLYGYDRAVTYTASYAGMALTRLPVFGIVNSGAGLLGIVEEGEAMAKLHSSTGGSTASYAMVGVEFTYCDMDTFTYNDVNTQYNWTLADKNVYTGKYGLRYRILEGEDASYAGMAKVYRQYLLDTGALPKAGGQQNHVPFYLGLLGTVEHQERFLIFPVTRRIPLTTFADALTMTDELTEAGVSAMQLRYLGWGNGGLDATAFNRARVERVLGGKKGLSTLQAALDKRGVGLYLDADLLYVGRDTWFDGFSASRDTSRMLDKTFAGHCPVDMASTLLDRARFRNVLRPSAVAGFFGKYLKSYSKLPVSGMSLGSLGSDVNSDKNVKKGENRQSALEKYTEIFRQAAESQSVMTAGGNRYSFPYVDHIVDLPVESSGLAESDYAVPFLAMVLHGSIAYTSEAVNMSGDPEHAVLQAVDNGAGLYFELAYQNASKLKETTQMNLYASDYTIWKDTLVKYYKQVDAVLGDLTNATITDHTYAQPNVSVTTYSTGARVAVNYTDSVVTVDGVEIPAKGFCRLDRKG